jgi:hypothetical protein
MSVTDSGVKCIRCIDAALKNKVVASDPEPVQLAVDGARTAVTVRNGDALCVMHLHIVIVSSALAGLNSR